MLNILYIINRDSRIEFGMCIWQFALIDIIPISQISQVYVKYLHWPHFIIMGTEASFI